MKKVLLIEDDKFIIGDLKFFIEAEGNQCEVLTSADQVIDSLGRINDFDCIVLDIMMRKGSRIERVAKDEETGEVLYRKIRERCPEKHIIVISGKHFSKMKIDFRNEAKVDTLIKPPNKKFYESLLRLIGS